jgi:hypothetical protein
MTFSRLDKRNQNVTFLQLATASLPNASLASVASWESEDSSPISARSGSEQLPAAIAVLASDSYP